MCIRKGECECVLSMYALYCVIKKGRGGGQHSDHTSCSVPINCVGVTGASSRH
jgi:hypothetical protein